MKSKILPTCITDITSSRWLSVRSWTWKAQQDNLGMPLLVTDPHLRTWLVMNRLPVSLKRLACDLQDPQRSSIHRCCRRQDYLPGIPTQGLRWHKTWVKSQLQLSKQLYRDLHRQIRFLPNCLVNPRPKIGDLGLPHLSIQWHILEPVKDLWQRLSQQRYQAPGRQLLLGSLQHLFWLLILFQINWSRVQRSQNHWTSLSSTQIDDTARSLILPSSSVDLSPR